MIARRLARRALEAGAATALAGNAFQLGLLAAAAVGRRRVRPSEGGHPATRFVVLIPAHDEQLLLPETLAAVAEMNYPPALVRVVVVADNCGDATAQVARERGAAVLERRGGPRGKGAALSWALPQLDRGGRRHDAVLFLDADCTPSPGLLTEVDRRLRDGAQVVQCRYAVANPSASRYAALRYAAFALMNDVRPEGRDALGLSAGILGSGFAVNRAVLERLGWPARSLTEDTEYQLRLLEAGVRVRFERRAEVRSPMPTSLSGSSEQHARWESGKLVLVGQWVPRLLLTAARRRRLAPLLAALESLVPPQSVLAACTFVTVGGGTLVGSSPARRLGLACAGAQALYVLGGLLLVRAPAAVYRALPTAPLLVVWKLWLYLRLFAGERPQDWRRTARGDG